MSLQHTVDIKLVQVMQGNDRLQGMWWVGEGWQVQKAERDLS